MRFQAALSIASLVATAAAGGGAQNAAAGGQQERRHHRSRLRHRPHARRRHHHWIDHARHAASLRSHRQPETMKALEAHAQHLEEITGKLKGGDAVGATRA